MIDNLIAVLLVGLVGMYDNFKTPLWLLECPEFFGFLHSKMTIFFLRNVLRKILSYMCIL